jgi:hypothetical protein
MFDNTVGRRSQSEGMTLTERYPLYDSFCAEWRLPPADAGVSIRHLRLMRHIA